MQAGDGGQAFPDNLKFSQHNQSKHILTIHRVEEVAIIPSSLLPFRVRQHLIITRSWLRYPCSIYRWCNSDTRMRKNAEHKSHLYHPYSLTHSHAAVAVFDGWVAYLLIVVALLLFLLLSSGKATGSAVCSIILSTYIHACEEPTNVVEYHPNELTIVACIHLTVHDTNVCVCARMNTSCIAQLNRKRGVSAWTSSECVCVCKYLTHMYRAKPPGGPQASREGCKQERRNNRSIVKKH